MAQYKVIYQKKNGNLIEEEFSERDKAFDFAHCLKRCNDVIHVNLLETHNYNYKFK